MIIRTVLVISMLATVAPAAVKRDDFSQAAAASSAGSQPVYSPSSSASSFGAQATNSFAGNGYQGAGSQYSGDHTAAASSQSFQGQPSPSNSGNLYYYYYPVQDKQKETGYQAASSNQYTSAVTPNQFGSGPSGSVDGSASSHGGLDTGAGNTGGAAQGSSGSDLNYSAQDLSYSAQTLGQGIADYQSAQGSQSGQANYDQTLNNLASQLQQYGYSPSSNAGAYNQNGNANSYVSQGQQGNQQQQQQQGQQAGGYGQQYYESPQGSHASGSEQTNAYSSVANQMPNYQQAAANAYGQSQGQGNGQMPQYHPAAAAQAAAAFAQQYPGAAQHFGNFPSASGQQHSAFEPATSGYRRYGIGSLLMPVLALAGLSLLIPTVTSLTASSRKKRSLDPNQSAKESAFGKYFDRMERYYSIYKTAVEREECMNRIICELGDAMAGVRGKSAIFTVLEKVVPTWMGNSVGVLKSSALAGEQYGKCKKYTCQK